MENMTEREKMNAGMLYDANFDSELVKMRMEAKELCYDYNHTRPSDEEGRTAILKKLFKSTGEHLLIEQPFVCDYGCNISVGEVSLQTIILSFLTQHRSLSVTTVSLPPIAALLRLLILWMWNGEMSVLKHASLFMSAIMFG